MNQYDEVKQSTNGRIARLMGWTRIRKSLQDDTLIGDDPLGETKSVPAYDMDLNLIALVETSFLRIHSLRDAYVAELRRSTEQKEQPGLGESDYRFATATAKQRVQALLAVFGIFVEVHSKKALSERIREEIVVLKEKRQHVVDDLSDADFKEMTACRSCGKPVPIGTAQCPYCQAFQ